jgi:hypothetical protein
MRRATLSDTLTELATGASPDHPHLCVEEAEISLPLVVLMEAGPSGPCFYAQPPWSPYRSGIEPVAHRVRLRLGLRAAEAAPPRPAPARADPQPLPAPDPTG